MIRNYGVAFAFVSVFVLMVAAVAVPASAQTFTIDDIGANYEWGKYTTFDGVKQDMYVFRPFGTGLTASRTSAHSAGRTAVVCIHGGGWYGGKPDYFFPHCRYYAMRGAVAFSVGYRFVKGGGNEAFDEIETCIADCRAALAHIRNNAVEYGIDPSKIVVMGDSAGGHLAACLITMGDVGLPDDYDGLSTKANAAVCCNPCIDMTLPLVMNLLKIKGDTSGGTPVYPAEAVARAHRVSPITHVRAGLPPSLVIHGTDDTVIPVEQAHRFAEAMTDSGNRCDLVVLDGVRHAFVIVGIGTEETIVRALGETDSFLSSIGFMDDGSGIGMKE